MKNLTFKVAFMTVCTTLLIACDKTEEFGQQSVTTAAVTRSQVNFDPITVNNNIQYLQALDTICQPYLQLTSKVDISNLSPGDYTQLSDGKLTIDISGGIGHVTKYNSTTTEWWKNWNVQPFVESNSPEILSLGDIQGIRLKLSKKCYVFGFEMGALLHATDTSLGEFRVYYYNQDLTPNPVIGYVSRKISWPEGATLIAIKSDIPFDQVLISYGLAAAKLREYAITNIRYITDKQIYDAHKSD